MVRKTSRNSRGGTPKYKHFVLYGKHDRQKVMIYLLLDLCIGFVLGFILQPYIVVTLTACASRISGY